MKSMQSEVSVSIGILIFTWPVTYLVSVCPCVSFRQGGIGLLVVSYRDLFTNMVRLSEKRGESYDERTGNIFCCY